MDYKLVRRIGITFTLIIVAFIAIEFMDMDKSETIYGSRFIFLTLVSIIMLLSSFSPASGCYLQLISLALYSLYSFSSGNFGLGMGVFFIVILIIERYHLLIKHTGIKLLVLFLFYLTIVIGTHFYAGRGFETLFKYIFYFMSASAGIFVIKLDAIKDALLLDRKRKREVDKLRRFMSLRKTFCDKDIDPKDIGLTTAEFRILKYLCLYRESNIQLALRLGKSVNTVKVQMKKILLKVGAKNRYQLIDRCKGFYIDREI